METQSLTLARPEGSSKTQENPRHRKKIHPWGRYDLLQNTNGRQPAVRFGPYWRIEIFNGPSRDLTDSTSHTAEHIHAIERNALTKVVFSLLLSCSDRPQTQASRTAAQAGIKHYKQGSLWFGPMGSPPFVASAYSPKVTVRPEGLPRKGGTETA